MDATITAAIIGVVGITITLIWTSIENSKRSKKALRNSKRQIERDVIKENKDFNKKKLDEFYYPLKRYLQDSKDLFKIFIQDKPQSFRTLTHLLDPLQIYDNIRQVTLTTNDKALLEGIFDKGSQIQNLIANKGSIIDDSEFVDEYLPSPGYSNIVYPIGLNLLGLLTAHLRIIKIAFDGDLTGEVDKYKIYVFPNEVNVRVDAKINELVRLVESYDRAMSKLVEEMEE